MQSLSSVSRSLALSISDAWGALRNCVPVYYHLIFKGHVEKETEGDSFILYSELSLLGDLNNYIYPKDDSQDEATLRELLRNDDVLLRLYKDHNRNILHKVRGITLLPHLIIVPLCALIIFLNTHDLVSLFQESLFPLNSFELSFANAKALSPLLTPLAYYHRIWIVKIPFRIGRFLFRLFKSRFS